MCAIGGVSFAPGSTIDRRKLASALLQEGEMRGRDASGYAWVQGETDGLYKKAVPASQLSVAKIPKDADAFIIHTRAATTGSPQDNDNNHPVLSPSGDIRLVHNGMIYNHLELRQVLDKGDKLATVDTAVIPAVIEELGLANTDIIAGDAAAAWFDRETGGTIHLARFSHSPVNIAYLTDGSIVFASTDTILGRALNKLSLGWYGVYPGPFDTLDNGDYIQLFEGSILSQSEVGWNDDYYRRYTTHYGGTTYLEQQRAITDGTTTQQGKGFANVNTSTGEVPFEEEPDDFDYEDTGLPAALAHYAEGIPVSFYTKSHSGDYVEYQNMTTLLASLRWHSGLSEGVDIVDEESGLMRWVNHFEDVGELVDDPEGNMEEVSWINDPNAMADWGTSIPIFVKDGVDTLRKLMV